MVLIIANDNYSGDSFQSFCLAYMSEGYIVARSKKRTLLLRTLFIIEWVVVFLLPRHASVDLMGQTILTT